MKNKLEPLLANEENPRPKNGGRRYIWIGFVVLVVACAVVAAVLIVQNSHGSTQSQNQSQNQPKTKQTETLIFEEEFNNLNFSRWKHFISAFGGGNWEFEYYTNNRSNTYVRNGTLYVKPTLTNDTFTAPNYLFSGELNLWGTNPADICTTNFDYGCYRQGTSSNPINPVQSARIQTTESFSFKYGRVEIRSQLPQGDWLWPAIWMLPVRNEYGDWPSSGEIDIIEARANKQLTTSSSFVDGSEIGISQMGTTLHWGPYFGADGWALTHKDHSLGNGADFSDAFHTWILEWTPQGFVVSVDDVVYFNVSTGNGYWNKGNFEGNLPGSLNPWIYGNPDAPFDKEFFLIINLAAGGVSGFFPDNSQSCPGSSIPCYTKPWTDSSSTAFLSFWNARNYWYPTWNPYVNNGESAALKVDYIRVYEYDS